MTALPTILLLAGLLGIFIGERIGGSPAVRWVFDGLGVLLLLGSGFFRLRPSSDAPQVPPQARRWGQMLFFGVLLGLAIYLLALPPVFDKLGLEGNTAKAFSAILSVAWPIVTFVSVIALLFLDSSLLWNRHAPMVELARARGAASSGLAIGLVLAIFGLVNYSASIKNVDKDLSLQKVGMPSDATITTVQTLEEPLYVTTFFPPANEVYNQIEPYMDRLEKLGGEKLVVLHYDHAFAPKVANRLRVTDNGSVVFSKRDPREEEEQPEVKGHPRVTVPNDKLRLGLDLRRAQTNLKKFDTEVQKRLIKTSQGESRIYFTVGHGERDYRGTPRDQDDKRGRLRIFNAMLKSLAMQERTIGAADGLLSDIPPGTGAVVIAGPTEEFLGPEEDTLIRYFDKGGRLFIFLDPKGKAPEKLLDHLGVKWDPTLAVNTRRDGYLPLQRAPQDRARLVTKRYSSHPSVTGLARSGEPMGVPFTGSLVKAEGTKLNVQLTVKSASGTFKDADENFVMDSKAGERVEQLNFAAAVEGMKEEKKQPGRAVIVGSTDVIADFWMRFKGNQTFAYNGLTWLVGQDDKAVAVHEVPGEDVPVVHSAGKTALIFYGTVFGIPGLVLLGGFFATAPQRRQRRRLE